MNCGLSDVIKEGSSRKWKFNVRVLIKSFIVSVLVSLCVCVCRVNHGAFNPKNFVLKSL
jgi:hypothetical protein